MPIELFENEIIDNIRRLTKKANKDNISRTEKYERFYQEHPEIKWAFLAAMVSRNAGWNMCDLENEWIPKILPYSYRQLLFHVYERANWLIFQDAYPQLLLYHYSTKFQRPMFHLLAKFQVSLFMQNEWNYFWKYRDQERLLYSLIINEQNVIQDPVILHHVFKDKVFRSLPFKLQDWFHFSYCLFPTVTGKLYGASVYDFQDVTSRIELGKRLSYILFLDSLHEEFIYFSKMTTHTGSRYDYEQYSLVRKKRDTPYLRFTYPIVSHHRGIVTDWSKIRKIKDKWYDPPKLKGTIDLTKWHQKKEMQIQILILLHQWLDLK